MWEAVGEGGSKEEVDGKEWGVEGCMEEVDEGEGDVVEGVGEGGVGLLCCMGRLGGMGGHCMGMIGEG